MNEFIGVFISGITALGSLFIAMQLYQFRKASKAESCYRLYDTFRSSKNLSEFGRRIDVALTSQASAESFFKELMHNEIDNNSAEDYSVFFRYLCHMIKKGHIEVNDVVQMIGPWLRKCCEFRKNVENIIENSDSKDKERLRSMADYYFPSPPKKMEKYLKRIYYENNI